MKFLALHLIN